MIHSKMMALFSTLSAQERRRFKKWVHSPFHNANEKIATLYAFLDTRTAITAISVAKKRAFAAVFGGASFDDLLMRRLMSEFLDVLEAFLRHETRQANPSEGWLDTAKMYRNRQLSDEAGDALQKAEAVLTSQPLRDARYFLEDYRLQEERLAQNPARDSALNLQELADSLARFFAAELLRNACSAASHSALYRTDYQLPYLQAVLADCASGKYENVPVIMLYYYSYGCLTEPKADEHFFQYKRLLAIVEGALSKAEMRDALLFGINYCIRRLNTDAPEFMREVLELYKFGLAAGTFIENGHLSRFSYKNIVAAGLKVEETEWVADFIDQYSPLLTPEFRQPYERFCRAKLCYQQGDLNQARNLLHDLSFDDVFMELNVRVSLMKIYFEGAEWRLLEGFLTSFERFVSRKKMMAYHAPNYRNIIQLTLKLMAWKSGKKHLLPEEIRQLKQQVKSTQPLTEREWLMNML